MLRRGNAMRVEETRQTIVPGLEMLVDWRITDVAPPGVPGTFIWLRRLIT